MAGDVMTGGGTTVPGPAGGPGPGDPTDVVPVGSLEDTGVAVGRSPGTTLFSVLISTVGDSRHGMPAAWAEEMRRAAPPAEARLLDALLRTGRSWLPDSLTLSGTLGTHAGPVTVADELDLMRPDALAEEVVARFGTAVPRPWRLVVDRPDAVVDAYRRLAGSVWRAFEPLWQRAAPLLEREEERIGRAVVTRSMGPVFNTLGSPVRYGDGHLRLPDCCPTHRTVPGRRLVLVPLLSGHGATAYSVEDEELVWIGYPLPGLARLTETSEPRPDDTGRLALVLGAPKAALLLHARFRPSVSDAASSMGSAVSTVTYHCDALVRAGLLRRHRHGREVRLDLTEDGRRLLDLLG
ncbi:hypothetical protein [Streptomyces griseosporeus]|uniref:hypothetical protein n=1 Tax=Streptomyces griseosporeus TaxID=1910 RepID=UPI0036F57A07